MPVPIRSCLQLIFALLNQCIQLWILQTFLPILLVSNDEVFLVSLDHANRIVCDGYRFRQEVNTDLE